MSEVVASGPSAHLWKRGMETPSDSELMLVPAALVAAPWGLRAPCQGKAGEPALRSERGYHEPASRREREALDQWEMDMAAATAHVMTSRELIDTALRSVDALTATLTSIHLHEAGQLTAAAVLALDRASESICLERRRRTP
jgi:hypothetical protein